ncbi:MAG: hypothetical protein HS104_33170 [Polyangiaceae bacterium]|nr:hypothetical protein [Polyangiaceae bacterium]
MSTHAVGGSSELVWSLERAAKGLALAAPFGAAIAVRHGLGAAALHAAGVPLGFAVAVGLGTPALCIGVAHADLEVDARAAVVAVADGVAVAGRVLAGLSPAALLLCVTAESHVTAASFATLGLLLGSAMGVRALSAALDGVPRLFLWVFVPFLALLTARVWWLVLPALGGGR